MDEIEIMAGQSDHYRGRSSAPAGWRVGVDRRECGIIVWLEALVSIEAMTLRGKAVRGREGEGARNVSGKAT